MAERKRGRQKPAPGRAQGLKLSTRGAVPWLINVLEADQPGRGGEGGRQEEVERPLEARATTDQRLLQSYLLNTLLRG